MNDSADMPIAAEGVANELLSCLVANQAGCADIMSA